MFKFYVVYTVRIHRKELSVSDRLKLDELKGPSRYHWGFLPRNDTLWSLAGYASVFKDKDAAYFYYDTKCAQMEERTDISIVRITLVTATGKKAALKKVLTSHLDKDRVPRGEILSGKEIANLPMHLLV